MDSAPFFQQKKLLVTFLAFFATIGSKTPSRGCSNGPNDFLKMWKTKFYVVKNPRGSLAWTIFLLHAKFLEWGLGKGGKFYTLSEIELKQLHYTRFFL